MKEDIEERFKVGRGGVRGKLEDVLGNIEDEKRK